MDAYSESQQRVLVAVKYILATTNAKFAAARILIIKGLAEQPEPTHYNENTSCYNKNTLS